MEIGQTVSVLDPAIEDRVRAKIVDFGEQADAVPVLIEGSSILRDVVIVEYLEGPREGHFGKVPYHLIERNAE